MNGHDDEPEFIILQTADEKLFKKNRRNLRKKGYTLNAERTYEKINFSLVDEFWRFTMRAFQNRSGKEK